MTTKSPVRVEALGHEWALTQLVKPGGLHHPCTNPSQWGLMSNVVPSAAVVAAGNAPAFVLADGDLAEMLAALAPYTTPARFQILLFSLAAQPDGLELLKHKHGALRTAFLTGWA